MASVGSAPGHGGLPLAAGQGGLAFRDEALQIGRHGGPDSGRAALILCVAYAEALRVRSGQGQGQGCFFGSPFSFSGSEARAWRRGRRVLFAFLGGFFLIL